VISVRGNWPLTPTMDVVVPYARTMADLLEVLDVVVADDADTRGDLWRLQPWVPIPAASVRPASYLDLAADAARSRASASACRACTSTPTRSRHQRETGHRRPDRPAHPHPRQRDRLWKQARQALEAAGAEVIEVDFPLVSNCEGDRPARRPCSTAASSARSSCTTSCGSCPAGPSTTSCAPTAIPSSTAWPMSMARRSSRTTRAPCPTVRTTWPPAWTSTSTWPSAA
jgi:Asp-tRNA(Asn)/Glu-tRNA(Gln) amidotransferase A subunit family amidase